jgi:type II secretory pathway component PulJ
MTPESRSTRQSDCRAIRPEHSEPRSRFERWDGHSRLFGQTGMSAPRSEPLRRGKSLIELVVVMTVVATVLLLVGRVLVGLFRVEDRATQALLVGHTLDRLASRLRADVRGATTAEIDAADDGGTRVRLALPSGESIAYVVEDDGVSRTVGRGEATVARDTFRLPGRAVRFEIVERGDTRLLRLTVLPGDPSVVPSDENGRIENPPYDPRGSTGVTRPTWRLDVRLPTGDSGPVPEEDVR